MLNSVGPTELLLLFVIALLILGPERLPKVATQLGRWVGRARRTANQLRYQLEREIALNDIDKPPRKPAKPASAAKDTEPDPNTIRSNETGAGAAPAAGAAPGAGTPGAAPGAGAAQDGSASEAAPDGHGQAQDPGASADTDHGGTTRGGPAQSKTPST